MSFLVDTDTCSAYIKGIGRVMHRFLHLLKGAVALVHNLAMVTHNVKDYANIPGLKLDDRLAP